MGEVVCRLESFPTVLWQMMVAIASNCDATQLMREDNICLMEGWWLGIIIESHQDICFMPNTAGVQSADARARPERYLRVNT